KNSSRIELCFVEFFAVEFMCNWRLLNDSCSRVLFKFCRGQVLP
ncbi:12048_t:CDS:1, partial [Dentiscutata heterogama]